jgi:hypothetical protein
MNFAWYALWFIVAVSLLVTVHEFGHFWVARRLGSGVAGFRSVSAGPSSAAGRDSTVYALAMLAGRLRVCSMSAKPVPPRAVTLVHPQAAWRASSCCSRGHIQHHFAILVL